MAFARIVRVNARRLASPAARLALLAALNGLPPLAIAATPAGTPLRGTPVRSSASAAGKPGAATARSVPALPPLTVDSLASDRLRRGGVIVASDVNQLARLRREVEYGTNQFRRYIGMYPAPLSIAAVGDVDPARIDPAILRTQGMDYVITDWPEPRKPGAPPANTWISDRVAAWSLEAWERAKATGRPPEGRTRLTPDWFAAAIAGLATPPVEQNRRLEWMRAHLDRRVPLARFLEMTRPSGEAAGAAGTSGPGLDTHPGPSPPVRVPAGNGAARAPKRGGPARATAGPSDELFDDEALAFAKFLTVREDERFLGLWYEIVLTGQPQSAGFNIAKTMLSSPDAMEREWLAWMKDPNAPMPRAPSD